MSDPSLGTWLRRERERRGITLRSISDQTKVAFPLLQGLEDDDVSRWPGGIFRRAFVRAYASAVGLDPEEIVKRFELEHSGGRTAQPAVASTRESANAKAMVAGSQEVVVASTRSSARATLSRRTRMVGTAADLAVTLVLGLGSAAAGSRLLWPVVFIAGYYAVGVLLTGTSPMVALLREEAQPAPIPVAPAAPEPRVTSDEPQTSERRPLRVVRPTHSARRAQ